MGAGADPAWVQGGWSPLLPKMPWSLPQLALKFWRPLMKEWGSRKKKGHQPPCLPLGTCSINYHIIKFLKLSECSQLAIPARIRLQDIHLELQEISLSSPVQSLNASSMLKCPFSSKLRKSDTPTNSHEKEIPKSITFWY